MGWNRYSDFPPYVPVAQRRAAAARKVARLKKQGREVKPVHIEGRLIAKSFWGKAWCDNLESYSDYENRLPRGRTYVRNGSVIDLQLQSGAIEALVSGSDIYRVNINIAELPKARWKNLVNDCAGQFDSMVELLQGRFSKPVMTMMTRREQGLFPHPKEIRIRCSCPDYAGLCKHAAAVLYGVGARLDETPELLFLLRQVDHGDLIVKSSKHLSQSLSSLPEINTLGDTNLSALFGIALEGETPVKAHATKKLKNHQSSEAVSKQKKPTVRARPKKCGVKLKK
ncbi:MAG: SWIM zinc finger family protein [Proteobacteria bacterium]|nr:SWIM zinc finger family protein [Pseudomonadota bacterium]